MANRRSQRGLTLIELLIAMTVAVFVLAALNSVTTLGLNAQASGRQANELVYQGRFALDRMAAKARSTAPTKPLTTPPAGTTGDWFSPTLYCLNGNQLVETVTYCTGGAVIANNVNARMIANRSDLDRARYAAEAGLQAVNFVIQGMGCTGTNYPTSSPVTNFFGATYSAYASRASLTSSYAPITLYSTG